MLKNFRLYSLALALFAAFSLVYSQREKTPTTSPNDALSTKQRRETLNKERLAQLMSRIGVQVPASTNPVTTSAYRQIDVQLSNSDQTSATKSMEQRQSTEAIAVVRSSQVRRGSLPKHRSLELASDQLLLLTVGEGDRLRWWSTIPDPRILRAERPGPDGTLTGEVIFRPSLSFTVNIPDDEDAVELRLYHPRWSGQEFVPVLISTISIRN
ncbi:MAG TPA: hypothetical protein VL866_05135 [Pyrinomonadaceae bacterium]|nr:hypothetical protein [Pyrinomonadaceae bacterium]